MYECSDIRRVHLELTTRCNAFCPQCPRNVNGGKTNPSLPMVELTLGQIKRILSPAFLKQLHHVTICGNYGDAICARDALAICQYMRSVNPLLEVEFHTNGSARDETFWRSLAGCISRCVFAIDGLEDTNHLYRRNTDWNTIISNAKTFISFGGLAVWNFIPFRHNEHQVAMALKLAQDLGFKEFYVKRTGRFYRHGKLHPLFPIFDRSGNLVGQLEMPRSRTLTNPVAQKLQDQRIDSLDYQRELARAPIRCAAERSRSIYISAEGFVFPCCWMAQIYGNGTPSKRKAQILKLIEEHGGSLDAIDAKSRPIEAIIGSQIFQIAIPSGWNPGRDRLEICARQCGPFRLSSSQKTHSLI